MSAALHAPAGYVARRPRPRRRWRWARLLDVAVIAAVVLVLGGLTVRAERVLDYHWDWSVISTFLVRTDPQTGRLAPNLLLTGLFTTLRLALWSLLLGLVIGTVVAPMRLARRPVLRWLARSYVEIARNTPPIVFIFVVYFFISSQLLPLLGIDAWLEGVPAGVQDVVGLLLAPPERINDFLSGLLCLALIGGAYITEILRAGLQAVPHGQIEAGRALGLRGWPIFRKIMLPLALRSVLPALAGQLIVAIKDSSLVSLISIPELTFMTSEVSSTTHRFFEVWLFTALLYFTVCLSCSIFFRRLEASWRARMR